MARVHAPFFKFTSLFTNLKLQLVNPWVRSQPSFPRRSSGINSSMRSSPQRSRWAAEPGMYWMHRMYQEIPFQIIFNDHQIILLEKNESDFSRKLFKTGDFDGFLPEKNPITWPWCSAWPVDQVYLLAMAMLSFVSRYNKTLGVDSRFFSHPENHHS